MRFSVFKMILAEKEASESPKEIPPKGVNYHRWQAMLKRHEKFQMNFHDISLSCKEMMEQ